MKIRYAVAIVSAGLLIADIARSADVSTSGVTDAQKATLQKTLLLAM